MTVIDITTDCDKAIRQMQGYRDQMPFALAMMLNMTAKDIQNKLQTDTFVRHWESRNKALPRALSGHVKRATKSRLMVSIGPAKGRDGRLAGEGFVGRQRTGERRVAKRSAIAIPHIGPGLKRLKGGSIPKAKKPRQNDKLFKVPSKNGGSLLLERNRRSKKNTLRYVLKKTVRGSRRLGTFERDVTETARRQIPIRFRQEFDKAMATAKPR